MEPNKTKAFFEKYSSSIIVVLIIIAAILVIVFVSPHKKDSLALPTVDQSSSTTATPATASQSVVTPTLPKTKHPKAVITIVKIPQVVFDSESAVASSNANASSSEGGLFKIFFQVNANAQDIYISQPCHTNTTNDGVSFSVIQNSNTAMTDLGGQNCILMSGTNVIKTADGRFKIPAYTTASFELAVSYQPAAKGAYQMKITQIGYAMSDTSGTQPISIDTTTLGQLKTDLLSL